MRNAVAPRAGESSTSIPGAGIGLRLPHLAEVATDGPAIPWLEIHAENFLANPHARELLLRVARDYPISVHTVGISIGSADGLDKDHLHRVRRLSDEIEPLLVSGHLAWSMHQGRYLNDLLPLSYDDGSLALVATQLQQVQDVLKRPFLVENPASYVGFGTSTLTEVEFLNELTSRTGCRLLCDVSNIFVSGSNMGFDPYAYIDNFPGHAVSEIHLGGFTAEEDGAMAGSELLIDTHADRIAEPVWKLYAHALLRFGYKPTLIEWDNALPDLAVLVREAEKADAVAARMVQSERSSAATG
jgi:hypothetical protein